MTAEEVVAGYKHGEDTLIDEFFHYIDIQPVEH